VFNQKDFNNFIVENKIIGLFEKPITLKSGRISNWYVNWRNISEDVFLLDKLSDFVLSFVEGLNLKPDCFYGVPEGATKLGLFAQFKWAKNRDDYEKCKYVLAMGRGKPKEHGDVKDKFFVGAPKGNVIILEDVTTTGMSLLETVDNLKELGVNIIAAIGMTNRNEVRDDGKTVEQALAEKGVKYYGLSNATELLPIVCKDEKNKKIIDEYFEQYGNEKIKWN